MTTKLRRKLIEVSLPLEAINTASAKEKSIRHGHPSTLHLWWARRPLASCRAVLFSQLVDDPGEWPEHFPTVEAQDAERRRLHRFITDLVQWENSNNPMIIAQARREIARSLAWNRGEEPPREPAAVDAYLAAHAPPVHDPFCGGGSIPLEAQRLGLKALASDLNPVAVLITKALVEIPPRFAGRGPVHPSARDAHRAWKGAEGLAADVRAYGAWMRDEAQKRIGHLYPTVTLPAEHGSGEATVIAWIWARTVRSPNPAMAGAEVPLVSSFFLSTKEGRQVWMEPVVDRASRSWAMRIRTGTPGKAEAEEIKRGTKSARGANFTCVLSGEPITGDWVKAEGKAGRMGARLLAVVAEGKRGRVYLPASDEHVRAAESAKPTWRPEQELPKNPRWFSPPDYGMPTYGDLFTPRQLVALTTFSDLVGEARARAKADAEALGTLPDDPRPLVEGGTGPQAYADAVATFLGMGVSRLSDAQSRLCRWSVHADQTIGTYARQALPMVWDFAESNVFAGAAGDLTTSLASMARVIGRDLGGSPTKGDARKANATEGWTNGDPPICTDPPYYDNIGYADLSDFFYVWLRRSLKDIHPSLFDTLLTPKATELVATPYRHGGKDKAEAFFLAGMRKALTHIATSVPVAIPVTIFYAFKQSEVGTDGITSAGWSTFLQAIIDGGLTLDGTWPMRTERGARSIGIGTNALASSIVLVCRPRPADATVATRSQFLSALRRELPGALAKLQQGAIAPVDLQQAAIGPGMAVFSRYSAVLEANDAPMQVRTALALINEELDQFLAQQEGGFDTATRFAITLFDQAGMGCMAFGEAQVLANARDVVINELAQDGFLDAKAGKVRLLAREEMPDDVAADDPVWLRTQALITRLKQGAPAAAELLARFGSGADASRDLAYRLFAICERRKRAAEGIAYNELVAEWPELKKLAEGAQSTLLV